MSNSVDVVYIGSHHGSHESQEASLHEISAELQGFIFDCKSDVISLSADPAYVSTSDLFVRSDKKIPGHVAHDFRHMPLFVDAPKKNETDLAQAFFAYREKDAVDPAIRDTFARLLAKWREERSPTDPGLSMFLRPAYQEIIGLGMQAVPLILRELEHQLDHWFWALAAITRENPVPQQFRGDLRKMRDYWLSWGRRYGFRW